MSNPLIDQAGLPAFSLIRPEHVEPAVDARLAACRERIAQLTGEVAVPTWETVIEPLEEMDDTLSRTWSPVGHLNSVLNSDELRAAYNACLPKLSDYGTEVGQNEDLFRAYQAVAAQEHLDQAQRKLLDNALRDFHLSGVDLPADQKARYKAISQETVAAHQQVFRERAGCHQRLEQADRGSGRCSRVCPSRRWVWRARMPRNRRQDGWLFTLDMPSYIPVMTYADNRELRFEMYEAFGTRASDQGPHAGQWDNSENMERILALRHELAQLLGFANYAERSLATKMARSPDDVLAFLNDLAERSVDAGAPRTGRAGGVRPRAAWRRPDWNPGMSPTTPKSCASIATRSARRNCGPTSRSRVSCPGLFGVVERLFGVRIQEVRGLRDLSPGRALLRDPRRRFRGAARSVLSRPLRPPEQARRGLDGCLHQPDAHHPLRSDPGRLSGLQLHPAGRRQALAADPSGGRDALP